LVLGVLIFALFARAGTTYDGLGNVSSRTNEAGETSRYLYDLRSNLARVEEPGPGGSTLVTQYFYDARGNVERQIDPRGAKTFLEYDPAGRLKAEISGSLAIPITMRPVTSRP